MNPDGEIPKDPRKNVRVVTIIIFSILVVVLVLFNANLIDSYAEKIFGVDISVVGNFFAALCFIFLALGLLKDKWLSKSHNVSRRLEMIAGAVIIILSFIFIVSLFVK